MFQKLCEIPKVLICPGIILISHVSNYYLTMLCVMEVSNSVLATL